MGSSKESNPERRIFPRAGGEAKRAAISAFLRSRVEAGERPATQDEIAEEVGIAPATVRYHLKRLRALGKVRRGPGARGTTLEDGAQ